VREVQTMADHRAMTTAGGSQELRAGLDLVRAYLEGERQRSRLPGLSAAIVRDQEVLWAGDFGLADIDGQRPVTSDTIYRQASVTKLFTATMLLQLRDAGLVGLDEPIERYLPDFRVASRFADARPPTFRQVAAHLGGLPTEAPLDYWDTFTIPPIEGLLASLPETELVAPPLTAFRYSNLGIAAMGAALARIADRPYEEYIAARILEPLGMVNSAFDVTLTEAQRLQVAVGYRRAEGEAPRVVAPYLTEGGMNPTGGLFSTVRDLARFVMLQFREGPAGGAQILGGTTLREMHAPTFLRPDWQSGVGLGWMLARHGDEVASGHSGGIPGWTSDMVIVPRHKLGVVLCSNTNSDLPRLSRAALDILLPIVRREQSVGMVERAGAASGVELSRFVGRYVAAGGPYEVAEERGQLTIAFWWLPPGQVIPLQPVREAMFRLVGGEHDGERIVFPRGDGGEVIGLRYRAETYPRA
jgi:CubicO group peptidase (beta-lactamase class C family)